MKLLYLESGKKSLDMSLDSVDFSILPHKVGLLYTIQFRPFIQRIKGLLEKAGKKVFLGKGAKAKHEGQVLGCDAGAAIYDMKKVDCFLFVSSGKWHAERIALSLPEERPFFMLSGRGVERISYSALRKSREGMIKKFYFSDMIGILVSTKPGQENLRNALELKERVEKMGKKAFIFIADMLNPSEFENFKIGCWVNTACPGLAFDLPGMLNYEEVVQILGKVDYPENSGKAIRGRLNVKER